MKINLREITVRDVFNGYKDSAENGVVGFGGKLNIRPAFQREFVYGEKERNAVLDTVTKGFPLNVMYWCDDGSGNYELLDGQQRTISVCQYVNGDFSLNNRYFHNLTQTEQDQILDYKLMVYICTGNDKEKLDWFKTINIAGVQLTQQELRNAIYTGSWLSDAKRYFNEHKHLSQITLKRQRSILYSIFEEAIYNDLCIKNPVRNIKYVSEKPAKEKKAYNAAQAQSAKEYAKTHPKGACVYIILSTGLRRGELLGLMWKDIDLDNRILYVRRAIEPDIAGIPEDGALKTKSSLRAIPISRELCDYLSTLASKSNFVLSGKTEWGYTSIDGFNKQYKTFMTKLSEDLGIEYLSPHELRYTYGTVLREKGVDLYTISRLLGHADSKVTEMTYVHNDIEVLRERMGLIEE